LIFLTPLTDCSVILHNLGNKKCHVLYDGYPLSNFPLCLRVAASADQGKGERMILPGQLKKSKSINRKERKDNTQSTLRIQYMAFSFATFAPALCDLCG